MTDRQVAAARARWSRTTPDDRRAAVAPAVAAGTKRRRTAHAVLAALEAAGITVDLPDDASSASPVSN